MWGTEKKEGAAWRPGAHHIQRVRRERSLETRRRKRSPVWLAISLRRPPGRSWRPCSSSASSCTRERAGFSGRGGTPDFTPGPIIQKYLADFADHFGVTPRIRFDTEVTDIAERSGPGGGWTITSRNGGAERRDDFDWIVVCIGLYSHVRCGGAVSRFARGGLGWARSGRPRCRLILSAPVAIPWPRDGPTAAIMP